ncbi:major paralogous domain-containing protein [Chitinophaga sp. YR573]|uniref:fibrobacter succinogenes major paralogous domain-containing protein n=1 Tax=Chitinophaga sp. YR573 TaxID=1881040 RepID=UPI0008CD3369|nr:fibrobacter succinogenes major paralogous domain-containing protein [Chitinophaga sp. YR573]SEW28418.1 major paralogous domain-containing protein [Chitinophaga sp. YR573]
MKTNEETIKDIDGNVYRTVTIGTQVWMAENLKTTRYNDGTEIPLVTEQSAWYNLNAPGYCWYNNDRNIYGALYNWYALNTGKLCPPGWHIPSDDEWAILIAYLGGDAIAGGKMKDAGTMHWLSPNTGATNSSGFTALPAGFRGKSGFIPGSNALFWSSTAFDASDAWTRYLQSETIVAGRKNGGMYHGFSIRCLKD